MKSASLLNSGVAQATIGATALLLLAAAPSSGGAQLLVSLRGEGAGALADLTIRDGGRIVGPGPTANSLIVQPGRGTAWHALRRGAILIAGAPGGCGNG